jgi:hypothetical protein
LNLRLFIFVAVASALFGREGYAASPDASAANTSNLDFKQWGLLAIQDGGRRKPVDTFAKEVLIRITGQSTYADKTGAKMGAERFRLVGFSRDPRLEKRANGVDLVWPVNREAWAR